MQFSLRESNIENILFFTRNWNELMYNAGDVQLNILVYDNLENFESLASFFTQSEFLTINAASGKFICQTTYIEPVVISKISLT